jgi:hypothetical protein
LLYTLVKDGSKFVHKIESGSVIRASGELLRYLTYSMLKGHGGNVSSQMMRLGVVGVQADKGTRQSGNYP